MNPYEHYEKEYTHNGNAYYYVDGRIQDFFENQLLIKKIETFLEKIKE